MNKYAELTPLKQTKRLKNLSIYTFDTETKDGLIGKEIFCWALCKNVQNNNFKVESGLEIESFVNFLRDTYDKKKKKLIFCHNLTFDIRFILDYCMRIDIDCNCIYSGSSVILAFIRDYNVKFIDSFQFLKESQKESEIRYEVSQKYCKIDCSDLFEKDFKFWSNEDKNRVIAHNKNDVIALNIILQKLRKDLFETSNVDLLTINTPASLSMKAFRKTLDTSIVNPFVIQRFNIEKRKIEYDIEKQKSEFARLSYYGGKTECFNHNILLDSFYIDVVSMYPFVMKNEYYPDGIPFWVTNHAEIEDYRKKGYLFIAECEVNCPNLSKPILPFKSDKLLFPIGRFRSVYCNPEIDYALECGYRIDFIRALVYPSKIKPFAKFVDKFIKIKNENSGGKRDSAKLILNTLYGKFGQKYDRENTKSLFFTNRDNALDCYNNLIDNNKKVIMKTIINNIYEVRFKEKSLSIKTFQNVSIASFVTSYARIKLIKKIHFEEQNGNEVYYCDTDSIVVKNKPNNLSHELGSWDIEKQFEMFKCYAPKCYIFKIDGKMGLKLKGLSKNSRDQILEKNKTLKSIEKQIKNNLIVQNEKYLSIKESLIRNNCILSSDCKEKTFTLEDTKRITQSDNTTYPRKI